MSGGGNLPVGPGIWGFVAFFVLAVALWLLVRNMNSRLRRMAYRDRDRAEQFAEKADVDGSTPVPPDVGRARPRARPAEPARTPPAPRPTGRVTTPARRARTRAPETRGTAYALGHDERPDSSRGVRHVRRALDPVGRGQVAAW